MARSLCFHRPMPLPVPSEDMLESENKNAQRSIFEHDSNEYQVSKVPGSENRRST